MFRWFLEKLIRFKNVSTHYCVGVMRMPLFCLLSIMDRSHEAIEETTESVNPMDLDPSFSGSSHSARNEHASIEALLKISQDMTRVLDRLTAP